MKTANDIEQFLALRASLQQERASIEARLKEIAQALDQCSPATASSPAPASLSVASMTTTSTGRKQYVFSAATKAKMAASQKARWTAAVVAAPVAKKWKLSAQGKANIIAAAKARGARNAAKKATTPVSAPKQAKRVISPEAKARMIAGAKNRWAKVNAGKKKA